MAARKKKRALKRKRGRPATYTDEVYDEILFDISEGTPLRVACRRKGRPSPGAVCRRVVLDPAFAERYAKACESRTHQMAAELLDVADDPSIDAAQKRVMVDARKFLLVKVLRHTYGDRLTVDGQVHRLVAFADMDTQQRAIQVSTTSDAVPQLPHVIAPDGAERRLE